MAFTVIGCLILGGVGLVLVGGTILSTLVIMALIEWIKENAKLLGSMTPATPATQIIRKSLAGQVIILVVGITAVSVLTYLGFAYRQSGSSLAPLLLVASLVSALVTALYVYTYSLSRIIISQTELRVINWTSTLNSSQTVAEWDKVAEINVAERGILAQLLGYGTLTVEAESGDGRLSLPFVPNPDHVRDVMLQHVEAAPELVKEAD